MVNQNSFLSINEVLADVLVSMQDEDMRKLTPGFYRAQVRYAIDDLGFDTVFQENMIDRPIPANHIISFPEGAYRIKNIHIYTGDPDDIGYVQNLYWKKNARTSGKGKGYTANNHPGNYSDIYFNSPTWGDTDIAYFFSYVNGNLVLSDPCSSYDYIRVIYDGIPSGNLDEVKMVPPEVRKAVVMWVVEKCAGFLKLKDPSYRTVQLDMAAQLDEYGMNGAWHQAKSRLKYMGKKVIRDTLEYNARPRA
jgi:hypothetical protein